MDGGDQRAAGPAGSELQRTSDVATAHSPGARADSSLRRSFVDLSGRRIGNGATMAGEPLLTPESRARPCIRCHGIHGFARCLSWPSQTCPPGSNPLARREQGGARCRSEDPHLRKAQLCPLLTGCRAVTVRISVRNPKNSEERTARGIEGVATSRVRRCGEADKPATAECHPPQATRRSPEVERQLCGNPGLHQQIRRAVDRSGSDAVLRSTGRARARLINQISSPRPLGQRFRLERGAETRSGNEERERGAGTRSSAGAGSPACE
jgi:hypothetical protein